uniref:hypothetical protein n=1 Tax=Paenarthrobacter nicotinovorans TaxID=29320 RepID=UPI003F495756
MNPEDSPKLVQAWAVLDAVAELAGIAEFRACTRDGTAWQQNPAAVRVIAATIRDLHN